MRVRVQIKVYDEEGRRVVVEDLQMADSVSSKDAIDWVNSIRLRAETPPLWGANVIACDDLSYSEHQAKHLEDDSSHLSYSEHQAKHLEDDSSHLSYSEHQAKHLRGDD